MSAIPAGKLMTVAIFTPKGRLFFAVGINLGKTQTAATLPKGVVAFEHRSIMFFSVSVVFSDVKSSDEMRIRAAETSSIRLDPFKKVAY